MPAKADSGFRIERLTHDDRENVHTYFKVSPWSPDGTRLLYFSFEPGADRGEVRVMNADGGGDVRVLGESPAFTLHSGAAQLWADRGHKVVWQSGANGREVTVHDLASGKETRFPCRLVAYCGPVETQLLDIASPDYSGQGRIVSEDVPGIHLVNLDGTGRRCLATLDDLLDANPQGGGMRACQVQFRLGAEFRPDHKKVVLFLVTRASAFVRDYYLCGTDGSDLQFLGALGMHIIYHPNCRDILGLAKSGTTPLGTFRDHLGAKPHRHVYSRLASYDTVTRDMRFLSEHRIMGSGGHPSPSPDGRFIVLDYYPGGGRSGILLYDTRDDTMRELASFQMRDRRAGLSNPDDFARRGKMNPHPVFSPDGRKILYNSDETGMTQLYQINLPSSL